jgi:hypothetical protein
MFASRIFVLSAFSLAVTSCIKPTRQYGGVDDSGSGALDSAALDSAALDSAATGSGLTRTDGATPGVSISEGEAAVPVQDADASTPGATDAACGAVNSSCSQPDASAPLPDASPSASIAPTASNGTDSAVPPVSDSGPAACATEVPDLPRSVFASPSGADSAGCGLPTTPCQTVKYAVGRAVAAFRDLVALDDGNFEEADTLQIPAGITLQGGWSRVESTWQRVCSSERTSHSLIRSLASVAVKVSDEGSVYLDALTVHTKAAGDLGESLYGIWVDGANSTLTMKDVAVVAGDAGSGLAGYTGQTLSGPTLCDVPGTGEDGTAGAKGDTDLGVFTRGGYIPGDGTTGTDGSVGETGRTGAQGTATCVPYDGNCNHAPASDYVLSADGGKGGCGGGIGTAGMGGNGGGSSIALYVSLGHVAVEGGSLTAGAGGNGGDGGLPGIGGPGKNGLAGEQKDCPTECNQHQSANGGQGGTGGKGGDGGKGGSGAGGNSVALIYASDATVTYTDVVFAPGDAGRGLGDGPLGFSAERQEFTP